MTARQRAAWMVMGCCLGLAFPAAAMASPSSHDSAAPSHDSHDAETHEAPPVNWYHGLLGERKGVEPNLLYRTPGMPVPFLAPLLNLLVLIGLGVGYGRKPVAEALRKRRDTLMREMEEGSRIKAEAEARLRGYQERRDRMQDEIDRIRADVQQQTALEKEKILREAEAKRERMRRDAHLIVEQERKEAHRRLLTSAVQLATVRAESLIKTALAEPDYERLAQEYLGYVKQLAASTTEKSP